MNKKNSNWILFISIIGMILIIGCKDEDDSDSLNTLIDIDGNVYKTIKIGTQVWMAENLKVTKFKTNISIPSVKDAGVWQNMQTPAYCWYDNDSINYSDQYGALYNWYTVNTGNLCPTGWHVPTDEEWTTLEIYMQNNGYNYNGYLDIDNDRTTNNKIAKSLAAKINWNISSNEGAVGNSDYTDIRNKSDFSALPSGLRNAGFNLLGSNAYWWTMTENETFKSSAYYRSLNYHNNFVYREHWDKYRGFCVRCVKN